MIFALVVLNAALAGKILGIAGVIYAVLQAIKKAFPDINGWWAVIFNVMLAVIGAVVIVPPEGLFSLNTLSTLLTAGIIAGGAAGAHGTIRSLTAPPIK